MKRLKRNGVLQRAAVLFTVLIFAASAFAVTAFATEITPAPDPAAPVESTADPGLPVVDPNVSPATDPNAEAPIDPNGPVIPPDPDAVPPEDPNAPVTPPEEELPPDPNAPITPGESNPDGTEVPPEEGESSEITISTPEESEGEGGNQPPVSKKPVASVNTDNAQINQAASRAAQATSDPDLLSSQDWSELLTSGEVSQSPDAKPFDKNFQSGSTGKEDNGNKNEKQGSFSWILPLGIVLIVLGLGGIAFFVYAQFFASRRRDDLLDGTGEIAEFTDISSDSSGLPQRGDYLPPEEADEGMPADQPEAAEEAEKAPAQDRPETAVTERETPSVEALTEEAPLQAKFEIAQPDVRFVKDAKPGEPAAQKDVGTDPYGFKVEIMEDKKDSDGNFDWDSFFDDDQ